MFQIEFYEDAQGNSPIEDFLDELDKKSTTSKADRVRLKKIYEYLDILEELGPIGEPYTKHLDEEIWELRPYNDRILFAGLIDSRFILLHHFVKKTNKTPRREIEKAKANLTDYIQRAKE